MEPYTLYLSMNEDKQLRATVISKVTHDTISRLTKYVYIGLIIVVCMVALFNFLFFYQGNSKTSNVKQPVPNSSINTPLLGQYSIAIITTSAQLNDFFRELKQDVSADFSTIVIDRA